MQRIEACESSHFEACKTLQEEVRTEMSDVMRETAKLGERLKSEAEAQQAQQHAGCRAALELAESYLRQNNGFRTPSRSQAWTPSDGRSPCWSQWRPQLGSESG